MWGKGTFPIYQQMYTKSLWGQFPIYFQIILIECNGESGMEEVFVLGYDTKIWVLGLLAFFTQCKNTQVTSVEGDEK